MSIIYCWSQKLFHGQRPDKFRSSTTRRSIVNSEELVDLLVDKARQYRKQLVEEAVPKFKGQHITEEMVRLLLDPYLRMTQEATPFGAASMLERRFREFVPQAIESVRRDSHMNDASGDSVLDEKWAEAMLVSFVNQACMPLDLGLYTCDIQME